MNFENINNNTNKNLSTMTTLETVANRYNINLFELYNSIMSEAPEMESENPTCHEKIMEGHKVPQYTFWFDGYGYFDWEDALEFSPKTSTKRYDRRDKSRHGRKYKKVNDPCGEKWNKANILSKKQKKTIHKQVMEDLDDLHITKINKDELLWITQFAYSMVDAPITKTFNQVLAEVMDFIQYDMDINFVDKDVWNNVYTCIESCYASTKSSLKWYVADLQKARYDLSMLEFRVHYYEKEIECMGLNPNDF